MQMLPVTYPHGPLALTHALTHPPGPPYQGPPQFPSPPPQPQSPPCPCPCPCPSCGKGVIGAAGRVGTAPATPAVPSPRALKPKAPAIAAAEIVLFRFTVTPVYQSQPGPSLKPCLYAAPVGAQVKGGCASAPGGFVRRPPPPSRQTKWPTNLVGPERVPVGAAARRVGLPPAAPAHWLPVHVSE